MVKIANPARYALPFPDWPKADQELWERALSSGDPEDDLRSRASGWRPTTVKNNRDGYGRWLDHLRRTDCDMSAAPAERVTRDRVRSYLAEMREAGLALSTQRCRVSIVLATMLALAPERDWTWLKLLVNRLDARAREARKRPPPPLLSGDILDRAWKALGALEKHEQELDLELALEFRNWLMVAALTLLPLRRSNFAGLSIGRHLLCANEGWCIEVPAEETKNLKPISMLVPAPLGRHLRHYLDHMRPRLLRGRVSDKLWISTRGGPLCAHAVYTEVVKFTARKFGKAINPHRFRHVAATSAVLCTPDDTEAARALLTHQTSRTTTDYYQLGHSIAAQRQHQDLIARLRRTSSGAKRRRPDATGLPPSATDIV